ncbi:MAG: hypothetical protein JNG89_17480, partial [Planctomycetaceae bacterium]|nr:hypothetical protein [Planctomycetaceae bacterium]
MTADRKGLRLLFVGVAAAFAVAIAAPPAMAAGPGARRTNGSSQDQAPELPIVRLNFVSTPWQDVLEHVAEETKSTLVAHDVPEGRFSRRDLRRHTRTEAVQILNQQLEPLGYRILEKNEFLTVIETQRARLEYPRRTVRTADEEAAATQETPATATPGAAAVRRPVAPTVDREPPIDSARGGQQTIRQTGFEDAEPDAPPETDSVVEPAPTAETTDTESVANVSVRTTRPVTDVARQLYAAFGDRVELMPTEADKLPAFRVFRQPQDDAAGAARETWFVLEMDSATNELHIHAPSQTAAGVAELVRKLDGNPPREGEALRFVPDAEQAGSLAEQLNNELAELRRR